MKKLKRFLIGLSVLMYSGTVFASSNVWDYNEFVIKENPNLGIENLEYETIESFSQREIDEMFLEFKNDFNITKENFTNSKQEQALNIVQELENYGIVDSELKISKSNSDYEINISKLRQANFIEGILDINEGMSTTEIAKVGITHANKARDAATSEFPNSVMLRDAFRHFSWNHLSTKDIGATKTRGSTINHEWGMIMLEPMTNYFNERYNEYIKKGDKDAGTKSLADTVTYMPRYKYYAVTLCKDSYSFFSSLFDVSNIMDLHNNCWGRAYAGTNPSMSYKDAFYKAKSNGELILDEKNVTSSHFKYVWQSEWYTY